MILYVLAVAYTATSFAQIPLTVLPSGGNKKAAVLPVPVCADAIISLPFSMCGITCSCTGVAVS